MNLSSRLKPPADLRWSGPLIASGLAILIAMVAVLVELPGLTAAVFSPGESSREFDLAAELASKHDRQADVHARRFEGRSPFVVPSRPPTRPVARPKPQRTTTTPPPAPKAPTGPPSTYQGPKPVGVAVNAVFFENGDVIYQGQERGGVTVLSVLGPNTVRLGHRGGEYEETFLMGETGSLFTPFSFPPDAASVLTGGPSSSRSGSEVASRAPVTSQPTGSTPANLPQLYQTAELEKMSRSELIDAMRNIMRSLSRGEIDDATREQYVKQRELIQSLISKSRSGRS